MTTKSPLSMTLRPGKPFAMPPETASAREVRDAFKALCLGAGIAPPTSPADGWTALLALVAAETASHLGPLGASFSFFDCKEKFGSLSVMLRVFPLAEDGTGFDPDGADLAWEKAELLTGLSGLLCECCGAPGMVGWSGDWARCLCRRCEHWRANPIDRDRLDLCSLPPACGALHLAGSFVARAEAVGAKPESGCPWVGDPPGDRWPDPDEAMDAALETLDPWAGELLRPIGRGFCPLHLRIHPRLTAALCARLGLSPSEPPGPDLFPIADRGRFFEGDPWMARFEQALLERTSRSGRTDGRSGI